MTSLSTVYTFNRFCHFGIFYNLKKNPPFALSVFFNFNKIKTTTPLAPSCFDGVTLSVNSY